MTTIALRNEEAYTSEIKKQRTQAYSRLHARLVAQGLFKRQYGFYLRTVLTDYLLLAVGWAGVFFLPGVWLRVAVMPIYLTFAYVRVGFLLHDAGHNEIFHREVLNYWSGLWFGFTTGSSFSWWVGAHNRHHKYPNDPVLDADANIIALRLLALMEEKKFFLSTLCQDHPKIFSVLIRFGTSFWMKWEGVKYLAISKNKPYQKEEAVSFVVHHFLYFGALYVALGVWFMIVFALLHWALIGFYHATIFAPNHKGMAVLEDRDNVDFLTRQILTTRDTGTNRFWDIFTGSLPLQNPHHLFTTIPRNQLRLAQADCQAVAQEAGLPYEITTFWQAQGDILKPLERP